MGLFFAVAFLELAWREEDGKEPGNFGDPFGVKMYNEEFRTKEISNGRFAIGKVVHKIERAVINSRLKVSKEVAKWVDGPTNGHNELHNVESGLDVATQSLGFLASFTCKDLKQDESPTSQTENTHSPRADELSLARVAESQHRHCSEEQTEEHSSSKVALHCSENEIEFDHLQRNCDGPIDVTIQDRGRTDGNPELTHVEVMHGCNQGDQRADVEGCPPSLRHAHTFHQEESRGSHHRDCPC